MAVSLSKKLVGIVDEVRLNQLRGMARAEFVRQAIAEKMERMGIELPDEALHVPDRVNVKLNETPDDLEPKTETPSEPELLPEPQKVKYQPKKRQPKAVKASAKKQTSK